MPKIQAAQTQTSGSRGRRRAARVSTSLSEINVVPLVDVMLVLLIIFMVTAPMLQRGMDVNIPVSRRAQPISDERIFVNVPLSYQRDRVVLLGEERIRVDVLHERIRQAMLNRTDKEVFLRGDGGISYQDLMDVVDRLKQGGVEKLGLVSKLPEE
jgi:biopolymer transport protein ExbD